VCVGDEIQEQECLSANSDDLNTFLEGSLNFSSDPRD